MTSAERLNARAKQVIGSPVLLRQLARNCRDDQRLYDSVLAEVEDLSIRSQLQAALDAQLDAGG